MAKSKDELVNEMFGIPEAAALMAEGAEGLAKLSALLTANDVKAKEVSESSETAPTTDNSPILEKMMDAFTTIVEAQADLDERIESQKEISKAATTESDDVLKRLVAVEAFIADTPKAARDQRLSNITPKQAEEVKAKAGPEETNPMWGELNVPANRNTGGQ